jgi:hypothetical protein
MLPIRTEVSQEGGKQECASEESATIADFQPRGLAVRRLVFAARAEHVEDHQLGVREKPTLGFAARSFRRANQRTKMLGLRQRAQMLQANSGKTRDFLFREELLARRNARQVFRSSSELRSRAVRNIRTDSIRANFVPNIGANPRWRISCLPAKN